MTGDWWRSEKRRAFARELTGIVLGVLIALAIGEAADAVRWKLRVGRATEAMRVESAGNRFNVVERQLYGPCITRRLGEIEAVLQQGWRSGALPPVRGVGVPGMRVVEAAAWEVATADGTLAHMDRGGARDVALAYELTTRIFAHELRAERDLWNLLAMLEQPGGRADSNVLATLSEARARAARANADVTLIADQADRLLAKHAVPVEWGPYRDRAGLAGHIRAQPICQRLQTG